MVRHSAHTRELTDLLRAILRDYARPAEIREPVEAWARRLRHFLKRQYGRGVPLDPQVMELDEFPDEIVLCEARHMVIAAPWMREWHGDAKAYTAAFSGGNDNPQNGKFPWNCWAGGNPA